MNRYLHILILLLTITVSSNGVAQQQNMANVNNITNIEGIERESVLLPWEDVNKRIKENMFVKVETNKKQCFVGEPLLVTYKLYTRLRSHSSVVDAPTFSGCSVIEMTTNESKEEDVKINGKLFRTYIIRKVQIFPLQEGALQLGSASLNNDIAFYKKQANGYQNSTQSVKLTNEPTNIQVLPLPPDSLHKSFTGVIGKFFIVARVIKSVDTANDNNSLELKITGNGNFMNIACPTVFWPSTVQAFEPQASELLDKLSFPVLGQKIFNIPFTCKKVGEVIIPPITFIYFDADSKKYVSTETDSIHITVKPEVPVIDESRLSPKITNIYYLWIIPFIAAIAGFILLFSVVRKKKGSVSDRKKNTVIEEHKLNDIDTNTNDFKAKFTNLLSTDDGLLFYTKAKVLSFELIHASKDKAEMATLENIIALCNEALYTPIIPDKNLIINTLKVIIHSRM